MLLFQKSAWLQRLLLLLPLQLLTPLVESILQKDMDFFAQYAVKARNTAN
jgi:hypothetical protein